MTSYNNTNFFCFNETVASYDEIKLTSSFTNFKTVLGTDKTVIVEATLYDGRIINLYTGEPPIYDSLEYKDLWKGHDQFWRKFFSRLSKKNNKKYINTFERWIKKSTNNYFEEKLAGQRIKSVKIWSLSQRNPNPSSTKEYNVYKKLLNKSKN